RTVAHPATARPTGPVVKASSPTRARREAAARRRGFERDQRRATRRARRQAIGPAAAVEPTAARTKRRREAGRKPGSVQGAGVPTRSRTAAAAPLRDRWMMYRTATLRRPVDEDTAPRTTMNWLGGTRLRAPTEA